MTKSELEKKVAELEKQLNELKNVKIEEESKVWKPKKNEEYYIIDSYREINACGFTWDEDEYDKCSYLIGNCFKTKQEAEEKAEELKFKTAFKRYLREHEKEKVDLKNCQDRWFIYCNVYNNKLLMDCIKSVYTADYEYYTTDKEVLEDAIKEFGEDKIKKYLFGIKED